MHKKKKTKKKQKKKNQYIGISAGLLVGTFYNIIQINAQIYSLFT